MYKYLVVFKGVSKELTTFEFSQLWKTYFDEEIELKKIRNSYYFFNSDIEVDIRNEFFERLTLTNYFGKVIFEGDSFDEYTTFIKSYDFSFLEKKTYALDEESFGYKSPHNIVKLADVIWDRVENPKVDLKNPDFVFWAIYDKEYMYFSQILFSNKKNYLTRMPKKRPVAKPYTLKSDMARLCVNYLGLKKGDILDPFCGIGGILLEAYDMDFNCYGNDISWNDIQDLKTNFSYYFPNYNINLSICDSREQFLKDDSMDGIITDIPYGKSSRRLGLDLYDKFLYNSSKMLKKDHKLVVVYANFVEFRDIALKHFEEVVEVNQYINKSLTRHILVLKNSKKTLNN